jgi:hypothetical protein
MYFVSLLPDMGSCRRDGSRQQQLWLCDNGVDACWREVSLFPLAMEHAACISLYYGSAARFPDSLAKVINATDLDATKDCWDGQTASLLVSAWKDIDGRIIM